MAVRLSGIPVAREMRGRIQAGVEQLHQIGQIPTMGIVRVGARPEDISYETGATKLAQSLGIAVSRTCSRVTWGSGSSWKCFGR